MTVAALDKQRVNFFVLGLNMAVALLSLAGCFYLQYYHPASYAQLVLEDCWGEYGTFCAYLLAALLLLLVMIKKPSFFKFGYIGLAIVLFVIGMEEISWGQRILNFSTPEVMKKLNYQSEVSVHNILDNYFDIQSLFIYAISFWVMLVPWLLKKFASLRYWFEKLGLPVFPPETTPLFLVSLGLTITAPFISNDEIKELLLAFAFLFMSVIIFGRVFSSDKVKSVDVLRHLMVVLILGVVLTGAMVRFWGSKWKDEGRFKGQLHWMAAIEYGKKNLPRQQQQLFEYILAEPHFHRPETLIQFGLALAKHKNPKAQAILEMALRQEVIKQQKDPGNPKYSRNLGLIYYLMGRGDASVQELNLALKKGLAHLAESGRSGDFDQIFSVFETNIIRRDYAAARKNIDEATKSVSLSEQAIKVELWEERLESIEKLSYEQFLQLLQFMYL